MHAAGADTVHKQMKQSMQNTGQLLSKTGVLVQASEATTERTASTLMEARSVSAAAEQQSVSMKGLSEALAAVDELAGQLKCTAEKLK